MIVTEKRKAQEFITLNLCRNLMEYTKKIVDGKYTIKTQNEKEKIVPYISKDNHFIKIDIMKNTLYLDQAISAANLIKVNTQEEYEKRKSLQLDALIYLDKIEEAIILLITWENRIPENKYINWIQEKIKLEKALRAWIKQNSDKYDM